MLRAVWAGGVRHFDCASLPEIALVRRLLPRAEVHFMHPVKSRPAIHAAFHQYGVTDFALDSKDELEKILQETVRAELVGTPPVLGLFVRLAVKQGGAYDLSGKFGVAVAEAAELLRLARPHAARLGLCFHVGSQCLDPVGLCQGDGAGGRGRRAVRRRDRHRRCRRRVSGQLSGCRAAAARRLRRGDRRGGGAVRRRRQAVGRAGAGAGGGRRVGRRAGAAAPRRRAVRQ